MQEMNLIRLSQPDYPAIGSSAMCSPISPGLQNSRGIAPTVGALQDDHALPLHSAAEHNPVETGEKVGSEDEINPGWRCGGKFFGKSDKFMWLFTSWQTFIE